MSVEAYPLTVVENAVEIATQYIERLQNLSESSRGTLISHYVVPWAVEAEKAYCDLTEDERDELPYFDFIDAFTERKIKETFGENVDANKIETPADAAALFRAALPKESKEERVFVLPLGADGEVLQKPILVSLGAQAGTAGVQLGEVFAEAYKAGAKAIVIAHNHPSGDPTPSRADLAFTAALKDMCDRLGNIQFLDHIIIGAPDSADGQGFVSISEAE